MKALAASFVLSLALPLTAAGWGGPLQGPMLPPSNTVTDAQSKQMMDFMTKELKFVEGSFINAFSSQTFTGTSSPVARFIALVKESGAWDVTVIFKDMADPKAGLRIVSDDSPGKIKMVVNLGREDFLLKDFAAFLPGQQQAK